MFMEGKPVRMLELPGKLSDEKSLRFDYAALRQGLDHDDI